MLAACPVHPKGIMVIPMLWRIHGYVVCVLGVKNQKHHTHPYRGGPFPRICARAAGTRPGATRRARAVRRRCPVCMLAPPPPGGRQPHSERVAIGTAGPRDP